MLDPARMFGVLKITADLAIVEPAAKPGLMPHHEWHNDGENAQHHHQQNTAGQTLHDTDCCFALSAAACASTDTARCSPPIAAAGFGRFNCFNKPPRNAA